MTSKYIFLCSLCFLSLETVRCTDVYLVDLPNAEDTLLNNYDDYDPINEFDDNGEDLSILPVHPSIIDLTRIPLSKPVKSSPSIKCHKLYGSIYGNNNHAFRCRKSLRKQLTWKRKSPLLYKLGFDDFNRLGFSQDYLDVRDLGRSHFSEHPKVQFRLVPEVGLQEYQTVTKIPCEAFDLDELGQLTKTNCITYSTEERSRY